MTVAMDKSHDPSRPVTSRPGLSDKKREAILQGAEAAFLKDGFGGASMDQVAALAGVSKMTVYRHFGSKEELFAGVITDLCQFIVAEDLDAIFAQEPQHALRAFARKMTDIVFEPDTAELHRIVIAESRRFPKLGQLFYETGPQACIDALEAFFIRNKGNTSLKVEDPRRSAEEFLELLRGYSHLKMLLGIETKPTKHDVDVRIESAVRHILG